MAVIADDLWRGINDAVTRGRRTTVGYVTGCMFALAGIVTGANPLGVTLVAIGGALIFGSLLVPVAASRIAERLRQPDMTTELADVEAATHAAIAAMDERIGREIRDVREVVARVNAQLR